MIVSVTNSNLPTFGSGADVFYGVSILDDLCNSAKYLNAAISEVNLLIAFGVSLFDEVGHMILLQVSLLMIEFSNLPLHTTFYDIRICYSLCNPNHICLIFSHLIGPSTLDGGLESDGANGCWHSAIYRFDCYLGRCSCHFHNSCNTAWCGDASCFWTIYNLRF